MSERMDIQELIEDHNEGIYLAFKREPFHADNKPELIKDILAFANASYTGDRYIIIGISKTHEKLEIFPVNNPEHPASLQQYIHDNVTPELIVTYTPYNYKGNNLMIITISNTNEQPYYPVKAINRGGKPFLKENDLWIRKGEHKVFGKREDLEKIYARKYAKNTLAGKINLKFKNDSDALEIAVISNLHAYSRK
jgi:predicted HTH transcriptional regulator